MVDWLKNVIKEYGMKGMSVWKLKDLPAGVTIKCIEDLEVTCVAASSSSDKENEF